MVRNNKLNVIAKGAIIVFTGIMISKVFSYLYRMLIARYLGPEQYGTLMIGISIISFATFFSLLGLDTGVTRYVAYFKGKDDRARIKGVITSSLKIVFVISTAISAILILTRDFLATRIFHTSYLADIILILALTIPFTALGFIISAIFRAFQSVKYEVYSKQIIENFMKFFVTVIFIILGYRVLGAAIAYLAAVVTAFLLAVYFLEKKVFSIFKAPEKSIRSNLELIGYSFPLLFVGFFTMLMQLTDTLMLGSLRTAKETGIYNTAFPIADLMFVVPAALVAILMPVMTELYSQKKKSHLNTVFDVTRRWIIYFNIPVLIFLISSPDKLIRFLFGAQYLEATNTLVILSFGGFLLGISLSYNEMLKMLKKTNLILLNSGVAAIVNIALNYFLISRYDIEGAAIATMLSWTVFTIITMLEVKHLTKARILDIEQIKAILCGITAIIIISVFSAIIKLNIPLLVSLVLNAIILAITYFGTLWLFSTFGKEDKEIYNKIKNKIFRV